MIVVEFVFVIGIAFLLFFLILNVAQQRQLQRQLDEAFYDLLEAENGQISLIQLAVVARVDASVAKQYLDSQVKAFGATLEVDGDGDMFYRFPKLRASRSTGKS